MDTSKEYIKQCDCPEIQKGWVVGYGDWVGLWVYPKSGEKRITNTHIIMDNYPSLMRTLNGIELTKSECLWLPRQDQIQGMMGKEVISYRLLRFARFVDNNHGDSNMSMEQLWLTFYMHEKHQKIWSIKENQWIKK